MASKMASLTDRERVENAGLRQFFGHYGQSQPSLRVRGYVRQLSWRYLSLYNIEAADAVSAIRCGYFSPGAAMRDGIIPQRPMRMRA
jgi:hypothetical protein